MIIAIIISIIVNHLFVKANPHRAKKKFKVLQLLSSALFSIGHGLNDSQKVM
jgi:PiT family inorganic phosphate transporter